MDTEQNISGESLGSSVRQQNGAGFSANQTIEGKYRIIAELAHGGMGTVYRAEHLHLHREVAIKVLRTKFDRAEESREYLLRFRTEASILARIRHPNAVMVYDFGFINGSPYLVMDLVRGQSLRARMREKFDLAFILDVCGQICSAIHHAHQNGVVHRDLKPDNIIVTDSPEGVRVTVLDFGISKLSDEAHSTTLTQTGVLVGTPQYMSPEQIRSAPLDGRSDLYSLGIMLYELLSGQVPFAADSAVSLAMKQLNDTPPPFTPESLRVPVSSQLERLVMRCLEKNPANRPENAEELARELAALRQSIQCTPRKHSTVRIPRHASRRAAALALPLLMFIAWPGSITLREPGPMAPTPSLEGKPSLDDESLLSLIFKAKTFREQGRYLDAIESYEMALAATPDSTEISRAVADCYISLGKLKEARDTLKKAIAHRPKEAQNFVHLGYVESELGNHDSAVVAYQTAVELGASDEVVFNNLGVEFQKIGNYSEAIPAFVNSIRRNNKYLRAYYNLAESQERLGRWDKAAAAYEIAIRVDQHNPGAYQRFAHALAQAGQKEKARAAVLEAMRLMPGFDDFEAYARKQEASS